MTGLLTEIDLSLALPGLLSTLAEKHRVPGAQLAVYQRGPNRYGTDRPGLEPGVKQSLVTETGELEYGTGRPVTCKTAFPVGSVTKCFTSTVAMILVADGDLDLDEPVSEHLPELDRATGRLTLRRLLSHTSGLASDPDTEEESTSMWRYLAAHARGHHLGLPAGTQFSYSNMGYVLVGHLVEAITGMNWWDAVESVLLRPLGIYPAFVPAPGVRAPHRPIATGHSVNLAVDRTRPVIQSLAPAEAPAGGLMVSASDLVTLGLLHLEPGLPDLLPADWAAEMRRPVPGAEPFGLADGWGLGLAAFHDAATWVGHDGNADGTACYLRIDPIGGWVVALTSNANTGLGMWRELLEVLGGLGVPIGRPADPMGRLRPAAPPPGCVGAYVNGGVEYRVAPGADGRLYLTIDGDLFARLAFHPGGVLSMHDAAEAGDEVTWGRLLRDPRTGGVDAIQVGGRIACRRQHSASFPARERIA